MRVLREWRRDEGSRKGEGGGQGGSGTASCASSEVREKGVPQLGQWVTDNSMINGANQQITLCFLQDLQSEWNLIIKCKEVMRVKSSKCRSGEGGPAQVDLATFLW